MLIKQLSLFVENTSGRLSEITKIIADAGIDIRALSIADTTNFGILRIIVDKPDEAEQTLIKAGLTVTLTNVIAICVPDVPGGFSAVTKVLADDNISVEYMYAFISRDSGKAYIILRVEDNDKAIEIMTKNNVEILSPEKIYSI